MTDHDKDASKGFRVTDRRRFTDDGKAREGSEPESPPVSESPGARHLGPVTFSTFVFGLSTQALMHLGEVAILTQQMERDLGAAQHVIDILAVLKDKTRNNLDRDEGRLLDAVLFDLRMRFVELKRGEPSEKEGS